VYGVVHHVVMRSAAYPQPFQVEPRGESPPARCPKPIRRNAVASSAIACNRGFVSGSLDTLATAQACP
jgi:hypothetical protein